MDEDAFELNEAFEFIQFTSNGFYTVAGIKSNQTVAFIDHNIDKIYRRLYNHKIKCWYDETFKPSDSLPNDIKLYSHIASATYNTAMKIYLKKNSLKINLKEIKDMNTKLRPKDKLLMKDALAMPQFYRYVIDVHSIINFIESDVLVSLSDDKDLINDIKCWFVLLYKYIMANADCEFIKKAKTNILHLTALRDLEENQLLLMIWRNGKELDIFEGISTYQFEIPNDNESISIVNLILSNHVNLGINIYIKELFKQFHDIVMEKTNCDIGTKVGQADADADDDDDADANANANADADADANADDDDDADANADANANADGDDDANSNADSDDDSDDESVPEID